jgi:hypothetical protein
MTPEQKRAYAKQYRSEGYGANADARYNAKRKERLREYMREYMKHRREAGTSPKRAL